MSTNNWTIAEYRDDGLLFARRWLPDGGRGFAVTVRIVDMRGPDDAGNWSWTQVSEFTSQTGATASNKVTNSLTDGTFSEVVSLQEGGSEPVIARRLTRHRDKASRARRARVHRPHR